MSSVTIYPTLNKFSLAFSHPLYFARKFIEAMDSSHKIGLDVGATYGAVAIPALQEGATIIANDLDPRHLQILALNTPDELKGNLILKPLAIEKIQDIQPNSLDFINASGVLHYLHPEIFIQLLPKFLEWLKPNGQLTMEVSSIKNPLFKGFIDEYHEKSSHENSPGWIENISKYTSSYLEFTPESLYLFSKKDLESKLTKAGFKILEIGYINELKPDDVGANYNILGAWCSK